MDPSFLGMMQRKGLTAWQFNMNSGFLMCSSVCRLAHPEPLVWLVEENWRATNAALGHAWFFLGQRKLEASHFDHGTHGVAK